MLRRTALALVLAVLVALPATAWAGMKEGAAAFKRGDYATALREWRPLAEQGHAGAQFNLGGMYNLGRGVPRDYVEAVKWYRKAAEQGEVKALFSLGMYYKLGRGVPQDYGQALIWFRKAAEQGVAIAQYTLGFMYANGQGVARDHVKAMKWYRKAAEQGHAGAQKELAKVEAQSDKGPSKETPKTSTPDGPFQKGNVAAQRGDFATALKEWKPLAEQGNVHAQYSLGLMYARGAGVPQNNKTAIKWYKLAAEQGFADAQYNLGIMYAMAQGTRWDNTRAHMWWNIAASQGHKSARNNLDKVEKIMSPTQLETAKKLAREWMEKHQK